MRPFGLAAALLMGASAVAPSLAAFTASTSSPSNTFAVLEVQPAALGAPASLPAGVVRLTWTASPTAATEAVTYAVLRRPAGAGTLVPVATLTGLTYDDTPPGDGAYDYVISTMASAFSRDGAAQTGVSDATPPTAATALVAASGTAKGSVALTWTAGADATSGVSGYTIRYTQVTTTCPAASVAAYPRSTSVGAVTVTTVTGLTPAKTYCFYLATRDAAGNVSGPSPVASARAK